MYISCIKMCTFMKENYLSGLLAAIAKQPITFAITKSE